MILLGSTSGTCNDELYGRNGCKVAPLSFVEFQFPNCALDGLCWFYHYGILNGIHPDKASMLMK